MPSPAPIFLERPVHPWPLRLVASLLAVSVIAMIALAAFDRQRARRVLLSESGGTETGFGSAPGVPQATLDALVAAAVGDEAAPAVPAGYLDRGTSEADQGLEAEEATEHARGQAPSPMAAVPATEAESSTDLSPTATGAPFGAIPMEELPVPVGTVMVDSDFEEGPDVWEAAETDEFHVWAEAGRYHMEVREPNLYRVSEPFPEQLADFVVHARVFPDAETPAKWGLTLRRLSPEDSHYVLFNHEGEIRVGATEGGAPRDFVLWQPASIRPLHEGAELIVANRGARLTVWLNGIEIFDEDVPGPTSGRVGLIIGSYEAVPVEVAFDDVRLETLP